MKFIQNIVLALCLCSCLETTAQTDSLYNLLDGVTVTEKRINLEIKGNSAQKLSWEMSMMHELPKILGNADPMHYTQLLPGIQTCSEYDAGLHVQGCDNAHNFIAIDGVPIYNAGHMLGLFSVFNASHFPRMEISKNALKGSSQSRLGGSVDMLLYDDVPEKRTGVFILGPMSSQGTLRLPTGKNSSLTVSARAAYLNLLYAPFLKFDDSQMKYSFQDYNVTYFCRIKERTSLWLNLYCGNDNVFIEDRANRDGIKMNWGNLLASATLKNDFSNNSYIKQTLYYTGYKNRLKWNTVGNEIKIPSKIQTFGYNLKLKLGPFNTGIEAGLHNIHPQRVARSVGTKVCNEGENGLWVNEYVLFIDYTLPIGNWLFSAGLRGTYYRGDNFKNYTALDPTITAEYQFSNSSRMAVSYGWRHQYLHKAGFSNMGLPTEFWLHSNSERKPQYAQFVSTFYETPIFSKNYNLTIELYYKRLSNQIEYKGNILDMLHEEYRLSNQLLKGNGENYGLNIMLKKLSGKFTGWVSYSLGRAIRTFNYPEFKGSYPASHERIHELNIVATFKLNDKWSFSGTFVAASGTPFTAPKYFYVIGNQLVSEFGEHNGNRLRPYVRCDLSVNYYIVKNRQKESGINLSVYNVTARSNNIFYRLKIYEDEFAYRPVNFLLRVMPSISYFYKF